MKKRSAQRMQSFPKPEKFPPPLTLKPVQHRVLRFSCTNDVSNYPITRECLLKLVFATDLNGTQGNTNYSGVRLKRLKIWTVTSETTTGMLSCAVEWQGLRGPTTLISDSGNSFEPAHIVTKPPKESEAQFWSQVSSGNTTNREVLFYITAPNGSIVDVSILYVEANGAYSASSTVPTETLNITSVVPTSPSAYLVNALDNTTTTGTLGSGHIAAVLLNKALAS
jgi:hypothetical protein